MCLCRVALYANSIVWWQLLGKEAGDVGFQLSRVSTVTGSVPQAMCWPRRELMLWTWWDKYTMS